MNYLHHGNTLACTACGSTVRMFPAAPGGTHLGAQAILTESELLSAVIPGCPQSGSGRKPCVKIVQVLRGRCELLSVSGQVPITDELEALTDGVPPQRVRPREASSPLGKGRASGLFALTLLDLDGQPLSGERVVLRLGDGRTEERTTDKDGRVEVKTDRPAALAELRMGPETASDHGVGAEAGECPQALADPRSYNVSEGAVVDPAIEGRVEAIARRFYRATGRRMHVTSGRRSTRQQAAAMAARLRKNPSSLSIYRDRQAASELQEAWQAGGEAALEAMLAEQVSRGVFLSDHLRGLAVDLRTRDLDASGLRALEEAARTETSEVVFEGDHLHVEL